MDVIGVCKGNFLPDIFPQENNGLYSDGKRLYMKDSSGEEYEMLLGALHPNLRVMASDERTNKIIQEYLQFETTYMTVVTQSITYVVKYAIEVRTLYVELFETIGMRHVAYVELRDGITLKSTETGKIIEVKYPMYLVNT